MKKKHKNKANYIQMTFKKNRLNQRKISSIQIYKNSQDAFESRLPLHKKSRRRKDLRRFLLFINENSEKQAMKMMEQVVILLFQAILPAKT